MFEWNKKYRWDFSDEGRSAPDKGPAITGSKMFRGGQYKNVIRETAQNSCDAKDAMLPDNVPVKMEFKYIEIDRNEIPDIDNLSSAIDKCYEYMKNMPNAKMDDIEILESANEKYLKKSEKIPILKISDFNTTGLTPIDYQSLMKNEGITYKTDEDTSGSFGFGKFAPYLLSPVNTILYSSLAADNKYLFQGRAFLSTFSDSGKRKQGTSLFGVEQNDKIEPIDHMNEVPEVFRRYAKGTDLYILVFEKNNNWMDQMVLSMLENFFFAIYLNKLEATFVDGEECVVVSSDKLDSLMKTYEKRYIDLYYNETDQFVFNAPKYWRVLNDERTVKVVNPDFRNKGEVVLYILTGDDIEDRSVLEMRSSGMKIQEDTNFRRLPEFNGILIATGNGKESSDYKGNISKFLREMESPAHNSWLLEDVKKPEIKNEAEKVITDLHNWIRNAVKDQIPEDDGSPVDAFGLSKILPDITETGDNTIEEDAINVFIPLEASSRAKRDSSSVRKKKEKRNGFGKKKNEDPKPRPEPDPDKEKQKRNNKQREEVVLLPVSLTSVHTPYISDRNMYRISFVSSRECSELLLKLSVFGDDSSKFEASVIDVRKDDRPLPIKDDYIVVPNVHKGSKVVCDVVISETSECALEVNAYVKSKR